MTFNPLNPNLLAQLVHVSVGINVALVTLLLMRHNPVWIYLIPIFLGVIFLKETLYDPKYETDQPFFCEGAFDFFMYIVGIGLGYLVWVLVK